jgi:hypothetical protein
MLYSTLRDHMGEQSLEAGFEKKWTPKAGRRGAGNAANGISGGFFSFFFFFSTRESAANAPL